MQLTPEKQWQGLCQNIGVWEGTLTSYDPDATVLSDQFHVLFIYVDSQDDRQKLASNQLPAVLRVRLHRSATGLDVYQRSLNGENFVAKGALFDPHKGHACFGTTQVGMSGTAMEFIINAWDGGQARVTRRCRLVTVFSAECLRSMSVFRERAGGQAVEESKPVVEGLRVGESACGGVGDGVGVLRGAWEITEEVFRVGGGGADVAVEKRVEERAVRGGRLEVKGDGCGGGGVLSADGRCVMLEGRKGWVEMRMVFLGYGVSALYGVRWPKGGEWFCVEQGWVADEGLRYTARRVYQGCNWVEARFGVERRVSM